MVALFNQSAVKKGSFAGTKPLRIDGTRDKARNAKSEVGAVDEKS